MKQIVSLCLLILFMSCKKSSDPVTVPAPQPAEIDLLANPTFESNGVPSFSGWIVPDTSAVQFSSDIPPGGSGYSVVLQAYVIGGTWPDKTIYAYMAPSPGTHRYRISCWAKKNGMGGGNLQFISSAGI